MIFVRHATLVMSCLLGVASGVAGGEEPAAERLRVAPGGSAAFAATPADAGDTEEQGRLVSPQAEALAKLDDQWRQAAEPLIARAEAAGAMRLAAEIRSWRGIASAPTDGRQTIHRIPTSAEQPEWLAASMQQAIWVDYRGARAAWADRVYDAARAAARDEHGCEAFRLLAVTLAADPDHAEARQAGGWVRRVENGTTTWLWPEAARRQSRREVFSPEFGWLLKSWQPRYAEGLRRQGTRWLEKEKLPAPQTVADATLWQSDHWRISQLADEAKVAELAALLEQTHAIWWQAFGSFAMERGELQRRFEGQQRVSPAAAMQAVSFASRQQYVDTLERLEPQIGSTLGIYWMPTQTTYFFESDDVAAGTVFHEATHQLFAESRRTSRLAGEQHGFWVIEAVACYMESLEPTETGWRLGGLDHGRVPMAVERLTLDNFYVPLETLCSLGRGEFQAHPQLPPLYSQISGLADFFLNGQQGRYREAFLTYLQRIYTGSGRPDSLAALCDTDFEDLDEQYRRHVSR